MTRILNHIRIWIIGSLMTVLVLLAIALVGVRMVGLQPYVVLSGSMEPDYHAGSLIYVKSVDPEMLQVYDPITYLIDQNTAVTHRIIEIVGDQANPDTLRYLTKGDANHSADGVPVHYQNIIGRPVLSIPFLGYVSNFIQNPPGKYVAIGAGVLLILLVFLPDIVSGGEKFRKRKKKKGRYEKR